MKSDENLELLGDTMKVMMEIVWKFTTFICKVKLSL